MRKAAPACPWACSCLVLLLLWVESRCFVRAEAAKVEIDIDAIALCSAPANASCSLVIPTGVFAVKYLLTSPGLIGGSYVTFSGTHSVSPGVIVLAEYSEGVVRLFANSLLIADTTGFSHDTNYNIMLTTVPSPTHVLLSYTPECSLPPNVLQATFAPELLPTSGFTLVDGQARLLMTINVPAYFYNVGISYRDQCTGIEEVMRPQGQDDGSCGRRYSTSIDYATNCKFTTKVNGADSDITGYLYVTAQLMIVNREDGQQAGCLQSKRAQDHQRGDRAHAQQPSRM